MNHTGTDIQKLVDLLGGWPPHFDEVERGHGESLLRYLKRDGLIDEPVFGQVVRYAVHRAAFDRLSVLIVDEGLEATEGDYMSGLAQLRAADENLIAVLERELLGTPYVRANQGQATHFLQTPNDPVIVVCILNERVTCSNRRASCTSPPMASRASCTQKQTSEI